MKNSSCLDNQSALVLHSYPYRNSSLIVKFFLADHGLLTAIARGVKQSRSKHNNLSQFQPFNRLTVSLSGKQELLSVKTVEMAGIQWPLQGRPLYCAYYLNELLLRLLPSHTDCNNIFFLYEQVLNLLLPSSEAENHATGQTGELVCEVPLRIFELKLLEFLGYGLNLSHDIMTGQAIDASKQYFYNIHSGASEKNIFGEHYLLLNGRTLLKLHNAQLDDSVTLQQSKLLLKWALRAHLGDKPLKSRTIYKQLFSGETKD